MKRLINFLIVTLILFVTNVSAKANLYFKESSITLYPGETKNVDILLDSDKYVSTINTQILSSSNDINYSVKFDTSLTVTENSNKYTITGKKINNKIGTISIKANEKVSNEIYINLTNTSIDSERLIDTKLYVNIVPKKVVNTNLHDIKSDIVNINFDENVYKYEVDVKNEITEMDFKVETYDKEAQINISPQKLSVGPNTITVTISGENNQSKVYKIIVNRLDKDYTKKEQIEKSKNKISWMILGGVLLVLVIILLKLYLKEKPYL